MIKCKREHKETPSTIAALICFVRELSRDFITAFDLMTSSCISEPLPDCDFIAAVCEKGRHHTLKDFITNVSLVKHGCGPLILAGTAAKLT